MIKFSYTISLPYEMNDRRHLHHARNRTLHGSQSSIFMYLNRHFNPNLARHLTHLRHIAGQDPIMNLIHGILRRVVLSVDIDDIHPSGIDPIHLHLSPSDDRDQQSD